MRVGRRAILLGGGAFVLAGAGPAPAGKDPALREAEVPAALPTPPDTARRPVRSERFGVVREDEYAWLRARDWFTRLLHPQELEAEIRAHLEAENAYAAAVMRPTAALQRELLAEMRRRSPDEAVRPPEPDGAWVYWSEVRPGAQLPVFLRRPRAGGAAVVLADFDAEARGKRYYRLSSLKGPAHSPDGRWFAWTADERGDEHFTLHVRDLSTGKPAQAPIADCFGEFVFAPDSRHVFWVLRDENSRPAAVFRREIGTDEDVEVYRERDPAFFTTLGRTAANGFVTLTVGNELSSEVWLIPGEAVETAPRLMQGREPGLRYEVEQWGGEFVVRTNADGAADYKLMRTAVDQPERTHWRDWVPAVPGRPITAMRAFADHFARVQWVDAAAELVTVGRDGGPERRINCEDAAHVIELDTQAEYAGREVRFSWESPRRPVEWLAVDMDTGARRVLLRQDVPGVRPADYAVERLWALSTDGVRVPVTVLRRRNTAVDATAPLMLYGYGAYGWSIPDAFSGPDLSLADRGWVVAIAHARGGGELGTRWFTDTLTVHKGRTVDDFVSAAVFLTERGYAGRGRIVGHSFSAGGIGIGGAINRRPELFAGAIGQVPFVDVLNTMGDESNPLVASAKALWGDPAREAEFRAMLGFAPYENVAARPYPAVLATAGLLDDRVGYWEAAKWVARIRARSTAGKPAMLLVNMHAGHQGDAGRDDELKQRALFAAFAIRAASGAWDRPAPGQS
ncbi:MAG: S9 family peptidase [Gluconacetobacter diazotrophicus]|nr:S9 family peptidase [Gluconacetobacter diazotrophicus]